MTTLKRRATIPCVVAESVSHLLAIEISNPGADDPRVDRDRGPGVCIGRRANGSTEILGVEQVRTGMRGGHDDDLMPAIDRLFVRLGLTARACGLSRVAVSVGPGGYTSVRVACAVAKMIAEGVGASCVGVPTASVVHEAIEPGDRHTDACVLLASKGESSWAQRFSNGQSLGAGRLVSGPDIRQFVEGGVRLFVGDRFVHESIRSEIARAGARMVEPVFSAAACARLGFALPAVDPALLTPVYPREPDAVTLWRKRTSG